MNPEKRDIAVRSSGLALLNRDSSEQRQLLPVEGTNRSSLVALSRSVVSAEQLGVISEKELKHIVTTQFEYPPLRRDSSNLSPSLVAAFNPFSAKGRAVRFLAARILLESRADEQTLCFSVAGAERRCGATYIAANLAVAFSEFGLRTLLIDANLKRPRQHKLFSCAQTDGLSTLTEVNDRPGCFVVRLKAFRNLSLLPAGKASVAFDRRVANGNLLTRLQLVRSDYDVIVCDSPAQSTTNDDCEVVAGICGNALAVFRKNHTRVSTARALLASLDEVGARQVGSVLCDF